MKIRKCEVWRMDLASFILQNGFKKGVEIGVYNGKSYNICLKMNSELELTGIDTWKVMPGYKKNKLYELLCKIKSFRFRDRAKLVKADAMEIAKDFANNSLDFIHYDLFNFRVSTVSLHENIIKSWLPKIKKSGMLIGRDFAEMDINQALKNIRLDWNYCRIGDSISTKLGYSIVQ